MQDELIYSNQVLVGNSAVQEYPNFLYNFLYAPVNLCGSQFYECSKAINLGFVLLIGIVVFFAARVFFAQPHALGVAALSMFAAPTWFASVFMPELPYFATSVLGVFLAWRSRRYPWLVVLSGVAIALASLMKPHALGLLAAIVIYLLIDGRGARRSMAHVAPILGSFFLVRFALGYALAGEQGLDLIGPAYSRFVNSLLTFLAAGPVEQLLASAETLVGSEELSQPSFGLVFIAHLGVFAAIFAVLLLPPLLAIARYQGDVTEEHESLASLFRVVSVTFLIFSIAIAAFAAILTSNQDDHSTRFMLRYFEFLIYLIPLIWLAVLKLLGSEARARKGFGLGMVISSIGVLLIPIVPVPGFIDSPTVLLFTSNMTLKIGLAAILLAFGLWLIFRESSKLIAVSATIVMLSSSLVGFSALVTRANSISGTGLVLMGEQLLSASGPQTVMVGAVGRVDAQFAAFGGRGADVRIKQVPPIDRKLDAVLEAGATHVLALNSTYLSNGFKSFERVSSGVIYELGPGAQMQTADLFAGSDLFVRHAGKLSPAALGSWLLGDRLLLETGDALPQSFELNLGFFTMPTSQEPVKAKLVICDFELPFELPIEDGVLSTKIPISLSSPCSSIELQRLGSSLLGIERVKVGPIK
jgi:hypothetical protein